jgi:hypothetical protein
MTSRDWLGTGIILIILYIAIGIVSISIQYSINESTRKLFDTLLEDTEEFEKEVEEIQLNTNFVTLLNIINPIILVLGLLFSIIGAYTRVGEHETELKKLLVALRGNVQQPPPQPPPIRAPTYR